MSIVSVRLLWLLGYCKREGTVSMWVLSVGVL